MSCFEPAPLSAVFSAGGLTPALQRALLCVTISLGLLLALLSLLRSRSRSTRRYVRVRVLPYRGEDASAEAIVDMFEALHKRLLQRWWRRLLRGQPSVALEVHFDGQTAWLALSCQQELLSMVQSALRSAYPNCRLAPERLRLCCPPVVLRLKKRHLFIKRLAVIDPLQHQSEPSVNRLLMTMAACDAPSFVQLALTPAPASFQAHARRLYRRQEAASARRRRQRASVGSVLERSELQDGLEVQYRPLFFTDIRIVAQKRLTCERVASELRAREAQNRLVERGTTVRHRLFHTYSARVVKGEGNPFPSTRKGVLASTELAAIWHMPSVDFANVAISRAQVPLAPAPPAIYRPPPGEGSLRDQHGPVSIHPEMRKQNTAVPGTVEQGKSSYLVATVAEDLRRQRCAIVLLDPKGDAAEAAVSIVPRERTCTLLDFAHPTCGFNPLAVDAPADVIADYVVAALRNLFDDADIKASSDRYLRNAIIAVLAYDRKSTLWDAARLLSVGRDGYSYRAKVGARVRELPELKEISEFFTAELSAQLSDARSVTTAKLDAPVNKLARLLNSPSIKRVLLNDSLRIDFDEVISQGEVLVVKGALGEMGAGNTSVLMQLLVGMLDAALARQQDRVPAQQRVSVALKVDEAPLALNRGFAETIALKRSAGLETVACWQTSAQWTDRQLREQLDALFAHRVYFATASVQDARESAKLTMAQFSDMVRPRIENLAALGHPDARLHLPRHHAIVSWSTPEGRQPPFIAQTLPMRIDEQMLAWHAARQAERGGRYKSDLSQPHWEGLAADAEQAQAPRGRVRQEGLRPSARGGAGPPAPSGRSLFPSREDGPSVGHPAPSGSSCAPAQEGSPQTLGGEQPGGSRSLASVRLSSRTAASPDSAPEREAPTTEGEASLSRPPASTLSLERSQEQVVPQALPPLPKLAAQSYRELVELDGASRARQVPGASSGQAARLSSRAGMSPPGALALRQEDLQVLLLIGRLGHLLSSEVHRRLGAGRAVTTTQRRLKRLADAGLLERIQLHRPDGGGVPMCCGLSDAGLKLLAARGLSVQRSQPLDLGSGGAGLSAVRREVHAAAWCCAYERAVGMRGLLLEGAANAVLSPPGSRGEREGAVMGPAQLTLPRGAVAHQFVQAGPAGDLEEVRAFETIRPHARITAQAPAHRGAGLELLVDLDDRLHTPAWAAKVRRYDHFLTGWSSALQRYHAKNRLTPHLIFVCSDRRRARECALTADSLLLAAQACAGVHPARWRYIGRERIIFAAERDVHEGLLQGYSLHRLPPQVRAALQREPPLEPAIGVGQLPSPRQSSLNS